MVTPESWYQGVLMAAEVDGGSAQHMWSLSIHLVTEHPHGSLSVHVGH